MKTRTVLMAISLAGAAGLAVLGDKTPASGVSDAITRPGPGVVTPIGDPTKNTRVPVTATPPPKSTPLVTILALRSRDESLEEAATSNAGEGLFASQSWTPPPPPPPPAAPPPKPPPPAPPMAPPLPFTYLGKKSDGATWEVFLARGAEVLIAKEQTVLENVYRVDAIAPPLLSLTYLPLKQVQTLPIGPAE